MFKKTLIGLLIAIVTIFFVVPTFLPSEFNVERTIVINTTRTNLYSRIVNLESWSEWSPWFAMEPEADYQFQGTAGVVGSSTTWKGEKVGAGKQTLTKLVAPEYIETKLEFTEPNTDTATGYWKFTETPDGTHVVWGMKGDLAYPIGRLMGTFMDSMIGKDFEKGLNSLKTIIEQQ